MIYILCILWLGVTGLVSIDYVERLIAAGRSGMRVILAFILLLAFGPFIGISGVICEMLDAIIDDGGSDDDAAHV